MNGLDAIEDASDEDSLWRLFLETIEEEGFGFYIYLLHLPGAETVLRTNLPEGCYGNPQDDPFLRWCCASHQVLFTGPAFIDDYAFMTSQAHDFVARASRSGMISGLGIPVLLKRHGAHGGFNLGSRLPRDDFEDKLAPKVDRMRSICMVTHRRFETLRSRQEKAGFRKRRGDLTQREEEILALLVRGLRRRQIAEELGISDHTTSTHIKSVYRKLGIRSQKEAMRLA